MGSGTACHPERHRQRPSYMSSPLRGGRESGFSNCCLQASMQHASTRTCSIMLCFPDFQAQTTPDGDILPYVWLCLDRQPKPRRNVPPLDSPCPCSYQEYGRSTDDDRARLTKSILSISNAGRRWKQTCCYRPLHASARSYRPLPSSYPLLLASTETNPVHLAAIQR